MSGSNGSSNGSHEESREGRIFIATDRESGIKVEITYPNPISGPKCYRAESLVMNVAAFIAKLDAAEVSDQDRAKVVYTINYLMEDLEEIIIDLRETGRYGFLMEFGENPDQLDWIASNPPANVDVTSN